MNKRVHFGPSVNESVLSNSLYKYVNGQKKINAVIKKCCKWCIMGNYDL